MTREVVTSQNRADYMAKKLGLETPKEAKKEKEKVDIPHEIVHMSTERLHSHYPNFEEGNKVYQVMKSRDKFDLRPLSAKMKKELGYK